MGSKKSRKLELFIILGAVSFICLVTYFLIFDPSIGTDSTEQSSYSRQEYKLIDRIVSESTIKTQVSLYAIAGKEITKHALRKNLWDLYSIADNEKGSKQHGGKPSHIFIYLYPTKAHYESSTANWIAMLSKIGENNTPEITYKEAAINDVLSKPTMRSGIPESTRREIYALITPIERRAVKEAEAKYPSLEPSDPKYSNENATAQLMRQIEYEDTLHKRYKLQLCEKYDITWNQLLEIMVEGIEKNWPSK